MLLSGRFNSFDLNLLENKSMTRPENGCPAIINNHLKNLENNNRQMLHDPGVESS